MNCKQARILIALWVGDDLDEDAEVELDRHVAGCSACHEHFRRMQHSVQRLHDPDVSPEYRIHDSLWPSLACRLPDRPGGRVADYNGWWVALAVSAACVAIVLFSIDRSRSTHWEPVAVPAPAPAVTVTPGPDFRIMQGPRLFGPAPTPRRPLPSLEAPPSLGRPHDGDGNLPDRTLFPESDIRRERSGRD